MHNLQNCRQTLYHIYLPLLIGDRIIYSISIQAVHVLGEMVDMLEDV